MRILALTRNASLLVALGSMMRDWEVVSANDVQSASAIEPGYAAALIDFGPTQDGLTAATELYQSGITIPCVVLGDEPGHTPNATVLVRPFSLEDLASAVTDAATRPVGAMPPAPSRPETPENGRGAVLDDPTAAEPVDESSLEPPPGRVATPAPVEGQGQEPVRARPFTVVRTEEAPGPHPELVAEAEPEPALVPEPEPDAEPEPAHPPSPTPTADAPAAQTAPLPDESAQAGRWRLRRKPAASPAGVAAESSEPPLVRQLRQAARNAVDLEKLIDELPFLADLGSMADGLVAEAEALFSALIASVYIERADGFHAVAHRGLSRVESGMVVPATQPLFSDVLQTGEGVLIQPVDLAQGLVAGIGGARTEALMGVPSIENGECVAVLIVGHDHFTEKDLDELTALANEAAPGLSVALAIARLRERI